MQLLPIGIDRDRSMCKKTKWICQFQEVVHSFFATEMSVLNYNFRVLADSDFFFVSHWRILQYLFTMYII